MKRLTAILCAFFICMIVGIESNAQMVWRESSRDVNVSSLTDPNLTDGIEIYVLPGTILVRTTHKIQLRMFTILGQLVSQATLNPGLSELKVNSRGIYILKIGNVTQKVAL